MSTVRKHARPFLPRQLPQHIRQNAAIPVILHFLRRAYPHHDRELLLGAVIGNRPHLAFQPPPFRERCSAASKSVPSHDSKHLHCIPPFPVLASNCRRVRERLPLKFHRLVAFLVCALPSVAADYTTYIGDAFSYTVTALTTDQAGNTYITGARAVIVPSSSASPLSDIFVSKVDPSGNLTLIATVSGKASDQANGITVDPAGNIYVVGSTSSPDFPLHLPLQNSPQVLGGPTAFLMKFSANGTVMYSTYLGGTLGYSSLAAVAADSLGNAYVTGETAASDYPHTAGLPAGGASSYPGGGVTEAFFAKISPAGDKIVYAGGIAAGGHACGTGSSCFTSTIRNYGIAIALDPAGNAYIAGNTFGLGLPVTAGALLASGIGAFVAKVNADGAGLGYLTSLGSANYAPPPVSVNSAPGNIVWAIAADAAGNAYIAGSTSDPNFPSTASAYQPKPSFPVPSNPFIEPPSDAFVAKLNPTGTAMVWASFLGGSSQDIARALAIDPSGDVWASGTTQSPDFPSFSGFPGGSEFLTEFNPAGSSLSYSARFPSSTVATALAVDSAGVVHFAGNNGLVSTLTPGQTGPRLFGVGNAAGGVMAGRVTPGEVISLYGLHIGPSTPVSSMFNSAGFLPTTLGGIQVTIGGTPVPLLYVSDTQINAVAPVELTPNTTTALDLSLNDVPQPAFRMVVDVAIPEVFHYPNGYAAAINQDGTINSQTNPAQTGSYVSVWATGIGYSTGADGQMATAAQQGIGVIIHDWSYNQNISPTYAGAAPGIVNGVAQINFQVGKSLNRIGTYDLYVSGKNSDTFTVWLTP